MKTLEEALLLLQRINGLVEQYALAAKAQQPTQAFLQNFRRTLPTLAANLKAQFGMIADQVTVVNLAASRGASETDQSPHAARGHGADQAGHRDRHDASRRTSMPSRKNRRMREARHRHRFMVVRSLDLSTTAHVGCACSEPFASSALASLRSERR